MICTPEVHLAMGLLISKEMMAPPKPMIRAKPSKAPRFRPLEVKNLFTPSRLATTPSTATTSTLVKINKKMRFMVFSRKSALHGPLMQIVGARGVNSSTPRLEPMKFMGILNCYFFTK